MNEHKGLKDTQSYWDNRARTVSDDAGAVEQSSRTQRMRFEAFLMANDLSGRSLLDVGCGVGDLLQHLRRRQINCDYTGYDISPEMIRRCRERYPADKFEARNILEMAPQPAFDYTISIGIHNIRVAGGREILEQVTRRQFELCRVAAHISILTDRFQGFAPHIQPWKAEDMLSLALSITPYVALHHDYLPNDFSLTLYRQPLIDTRPGLLLD